MREFPYESSAGISVLSHSVFMLSAPNFEVPTPITAHHGPPLRLTIANGSHLYSAHQLTSLQPRE